ncbi:hypothetical protein CS022_04490 [Veronia nyctiphanis]|uniref:Uncharacterized protein n=1 Tax=Veronia nyctiphanis TaxID=1278244 RepID=A0A4Q0YVR3_9GAMM|nr:hypothetical protein [Veronia nyctiphanis]RXJ74314.1 hypothetical protein CS022_04490 [Veronia nyctiphanis]
MIEQGKSQKELLGTLKQLAEQGVALESLSPEDQKKLAELAAKAGIPPQQLNEVFAKVKNQVEFEKANGKSAAAQLSEGQARNQKMAGVKLLENEIIKMTLEGKTLDTLSPERQQNIKNLVQGLGMTQQQFGAFVTQTQQQLAKAATA